MADLQKLRDVLAEWGHEPDPEIRKMVEFGRRVVSRMLGECYPHDWQPVNMRHDGTSMTCDHWLCLACGEKQPGTTLTTQGEKQRIQFFARAMYPTAPPVDTC